MINQLCFRITLATLVFCLGLGSQAFLPMANVAGASALDVSENGFEQTEVEEELLATTVAATITGFIFSNYGSINLGFQITYLSPVSPPPRRT